MTTFVAPARPVTPSFEPEAADRGRHRSPADVARGIAPLSILRRSARLVLNIVLGVVMVASIAFAAFVGIERVGFAPVLSPSMVPTFGPGDLVLTKQEPVADIEVGQILVLPVPNEPGQRYVHRVIEVRHDHGQVVVRTKGDANPAPEAYRLRLTSATVPHVIGSVPNAGRLALLLRGGIWRIVLLVVIAGFALVAIKRALLDR